MTSSKFDIQFAGQLLPGTDPAAAREQLQAAFKLSDNALARLFSGEPVTIKRGVDSDTLARYRERFRAAGALIEALPAAMADQPGATGAANPPSPAPPVSVPDPAHLSLAPLGGWLEEPQELIAPRLDLSYLSLVPGDDWTLEDCSPVTPPTAMPETGHLRLEPLAPKQEEVEA